LEGLESVYTIAERKPATGYPINNASVTADWSKNGYRLPTEAQWEYACRAGTTTIHNTGNTISDDTGWYSANSNGKTHQVGLKPANAWGLYDMHGNVWEWCWDLYGVYTSDTQIDPIGASSGLDRVDRGGSWDSITIHLRSAYRSVAYPHYRNTTLGFRLVRPL
jgi:formylglycine-generating enzyme required for sulfatase activity